MWFSFQNFLFLKVMPGWLFQRMILSAVNKGKDVEKQSQWNTFDAKQSQGGEIRKWRLHSGGEEKKVPNRHDGHWLCMLLLHITDKVVWCAVKKKLKSTHKVVSYAWKNKFAATEITDTRWFGVHTNADPKKKLTLISILRFYLLWSSCGQTTGNPFRVNWEVFVLK